MAMRCSSTARWDWILDWSTCCCAVILALSASCCFCDCSRAISAICAARRISI